MEVCDVEDHVCGALQGAMIGAWRPREADAVDLEEDEEQEEGPATLEDLVRLNTQLLNKMATQRSSIASAITKPLGIKQLLMVLEMARGDHGVDANDFAACLHQFLGV